MTRTALPVLVFGALFAASAHAEGGPGSTGGIGLKLPSAARPTSMGGAFTGLADDASSLTWNPAGLAHVHATELSLMHTEYLADTAYDVVGLALPLGPLGTLAGSVHLLDYGNLPRTLERSDGLYGGVSGNASPQDMFLTAGWGTALPPILGLDRIKGGLALKSTFQQLTGGTLVGIGAAAGALWDTPVTGLRIGTFVDNLGAVTGGGEILPISWSAGGSFAADLGRDFRAIYAVDTKLQIDTTPMVSMGAELSAFEMLSVRGGWRGGGSLGGPTFGGGAKYPLTWFGRMMLLKLDYAQALTGELGASHRFQLGVQFGGFSTAVRLGSARIAYDGGEPVLQWKGRGPGYHVHVRKSDEKEFSQLTDRPIEEPSFPLIGLPPGDYVFRIVTVDPYDPEWKGSTTPDLELRLESPETP